MHITILAAGSQGDIQPYLALAVGLKNDGYDIRFAANSNFADLAARYAVDFFPIQVDSFKYTQTPKGRAWLESDTVLKLILNTGRAVRPVINQLFVDSWDACQGSDVLIYHSFTLPFVHHIGKELGIPAIPASIYPLPTRAYPAIPLNIKRSRNKTFNLLSHLLVHQFSWQVFWPIVRRSWQGRNNLSPVDPYWQILRDKSPVLCAYSAVTAPKPADLPEQVAISGYWFLEPEPDWQPEPQLIDFIHSGQRPIYVGFGSMGSQIERHNTANMILEALAKTGQRAVLGGGWSGLGAGQQLPENVFLLKSIPHKWLFPQMAAIVHHGGSGTTGAALRAGVPSVVVPHFGDQHFWGKRVAELGAGPQAIPRKKLSAERLTQAISIAITDQGIQAKASAIGAQIRAEDGIMQAIQVIRRYIER